MAKMQDAGARDHRRAATGSCAPSTWPPPASAAGTCRTSARSCTTSTPRHWPGPATQGRDVLADSDGYAVPGMPGPGVEKYNRVMDAFYPDHSVGLLTLYSFLGMQVFEDGVASMGDSGHPDRAPGLPRRSRWLHRRRPGAAVHGDADRSHRHRRCAPPPTEQRRLMGAADTDVGLPGEVVVDRGVQRRHPDLLCRQGDEVEAVGVQPALHPGQVGEVLIEHPTERGPTLRH